MKACVVSIESMCQSSVQSLPRHFGHLQTRLPHMPFSKTERGLTRYDGGSEVGVLQEEMSAGVTLSEAQAKFLETDDADD